LNLGGFFLEGREIFPSSTVPCVSPTEDVAFDNNLYPENRKIGKKGRFTTEIIHCNRDLYEMPTTELKKKMSYLLFFDVLHLLCHGTMKRNSKSVNRKRGWKRRRQEGDTKKSIMIEKLLHEQIS